MKIKIFCDSADFKIIKKYKQVYVFVGDSPFVDSHIISRMYLSHINNFSDVTILSSIFEDKKLPYARIVRDSKKILKKLLKKLMPIMKNLKLKNYFVLIIYLNQKF